MNLRSKGVITAFLQLQAPYKVGDVDVSSLNCNGAQAQDATVAANRLVAHFRTADLKGVTPGSSVSLAVSGYLQDGSVFSAADQVRVIR